VVLVIFFGVWYGERINTVGDSSVSPELVALLIC